MHDTHYRSRLIDCWNTISTFSVKRRKGLMLLCRAREVVTNNPFNLLAIQADTTSSSSDITLPDEHRAYIGFVVLNQDLIKSTIFSSIILDMCRSTPLRPDQIKEQKIASWGKEVSICESAESDLNFDFSCWFYEECHDRPLVAGSSPNPRMAARIHKALCDWKEKCTKRIFYPRMSRKQVSAATVREYENLFGRDWVSDEKDGGVEFTQETLERIYHCLGIEIEGPCEIRQKWYTSGITPRTYFAQGGTSYQSSKYIQEPAGMLTEELPTTHPISRLNPARINLKDPSFYLRIYDLVAFTSNHWECKHFVEQLGQWCLGTSVYVVDAVEGLILVDFGELILEYNHTMNYFPEYSLERIGEEFDEVVEHHNRAGFLGVYGNINFSTFLHGASLLMVVDETDEANVAGDDAHYKECSGYEESADRIIACNGLLEPSKTFRSDQTGAVCLKRGLVQVGERCLPKLMTVFPSFSNLGALFSYYPPQFQHKRMSGRAKLNLVGAELFRFLRGIFLSDVKDDLDATYDLVRAIYESACLPKCGSLPPYGDTLIPALPDTPDQMRLLSPLDLLLHNHFSGGATLPKLLNTDDPDDSEDPCLYAGGEWSGASNSKLKYIEVLGYLVKKEETEVLWGISAYNRIIDVFSNNGKKVYTFTCVMDVPEHLLLLP